MLDQSLTGAQVVDTPENQFSSLIDEKMAPMNQILEQLNQIQAGKAQEKNVTNNTIRRLKKPRMANPMSSALCCFG